MKNDPSWPVYAVPLAAAAVSVLGALYVGWRQRRLNRALVEFQAKVGDEVFRRQLCLAFSSRAHVVVNRASEINRVIAVLTQLEPQARQRELERKTERLDRACDGFLDAWAALLSAELSTPELARLVDEFTEELEAARLRMLIPADGIEPLESVIDVARRCHRESSVLVSRYGNA